MMDIHSKSDYPLNALSNFFAHTFYIDGIMCASMEGFLQSLKFKDPKQQYNICQLTGGAAKDAGMTCDWRADQTLYWQGTPLARSGQGYQHLLTRAFNALATNDHFKAALKHTGNAPLDHSIGIDDPRETVLTRQEFLNQLMRLRRNL